MLMNPPEREESSPSQPGLDEPRWMRAVSGLQKDLRLWLLMVAVLGGFRLVLVFLFRSSLANETGGWDVLKCAINGVRFDASIATYWVVPAVLLSMASAVPGWHRWTERARWAWGLVFLGVTLLLCVVDVGFFAEYKDQFNHWLLGTIFDDRTAILKTLWRGYPVLGCLLAWAVLLACGGWALGWFLRRPLLSPERARSVFAPFWRRAAAAVLLLALVILGCRGSWGRRPIQLLDAAVTRDECLNRMVVNPYSAIKYAITHYRQVASANGLKVFLPDGNLRAAICRIYPQASASASTVDECLKKAAHGFPGPKPQHLFIIVMESYDVWPTLPRYQALGLTPALSALASNGICVKAFVPASDGTMPSLSAFITGLPTVGVFANYQPGARQPFPTSMAPLFKQLGYRTRLFYSGYLSWERLGDFAREQGFDEVHGGGQIDPRGFGGEWGVPDGEMFRYVLEHVPSNQPSCNLIMSTSYHPPYDLDVFGMGYPHRQMPAALAPIYDGKVPLRIFAHLWYADRELGRFVSEGERRLPAAVFAMTGDHWSRKFPNSQPSLYERTSVPLVLYGPHVLSGVTAPARMAGGHIDIVPTLVELAAPAGFAYHSFGSNLLDADRVPVGMGQYGVISPDWIFDARQPTSVQGLDGRPLAAVPDSARAAAEAQRARQALSWWRIMKGNALPSR